MSGIPHEEVDQPSIHDLWLAEAERLSVPGHYLANMEGFLAEMRDHHVGTYEHSMRIGMLAPRIGSHVVELKGLSPKVLFYAGTMHDRGKLKTPRELLDKTTKWTEEDAQALRAHPMDSYEALVQEGMILTAGAVILHHTFQPKPYPAEIPKPDSQLPEHLVKLQPTLGRVIALADFYDASHRNDSEGNLSSDEIKAKMYQSNPDLIELIKKLYDEGILT